LARIKAAAQDPTAPLMPLFQIAAGALPPLIFLAWALDAAGRQSAQIVVSANQSSSSRSGIAWAACV